MLSLFTYLRKIIALNQNEENIIYQFLSEKIYRKGHFLVKEDEISDRVFL